MEYRFLSNAVIATVQLKSRKYEEWLGTLKDGDFVALQEFHPQSDTFLLGEAADRWQFTPGHYRDAKDGGYGGSCWFKSLSGHPSQISPDGDQKGSVFQSRIVPWGKDLPIEGRMYSACRPIFEPKWQGVRGFALRKADGAPSRDPNYNGVPFHCRELQEGRLITLYGGRENLRQRVEDAGDLWLYSEELSGGGHGGNN
jgi:hypothetical protein